jgi:hypothetical protein
MSTYEDNVFLNVPFDQRYKRLFDSLVFAVYDCGFTARAALEVVDSGQPRVEKILNLISECRFGIHDISRAGLDRNTGLPRFNMPLELGFFLGARRFGSAKDAEKKCLVLDRERFRYRDFCSDISGQDIRAHHDEPQQAIRAVRDWLSSHRAGIRIPGGTAIFERYRRFRAQLSAQANDLKLDIRELTFGDYITLVKGWLDEAR